jgi:hypothetical protein
MKFPIYGKNHVPNHQPDKDVKTYGKCGKHLGKSS